MARRKSRPAKVIDYDTLSPELKELYNKIYTTLDMKNIFKLRDEAREMNVESPTTLAKAALLKRITDHIICDYVPEYNQEERAGWEVFKNGIKGEVIEGLYEEFNGSGRVGRVFMPDTLRKEKGIRFGDFVKGLVADLNGERTIVAVDRVEGEMPSLSRDNWFEEIPIGEARPLPTCPLPKLMTGERVILQKSDLEFSKKLLQNFPYHIGLFLGMTPEEKNFADNKSTFCVTFDMTDVEVQRIARLVLERAKRLSEREKEVVLVVYNFDLIANNDLEKAIFGAGRSFDNGSLTIIADVNKDKNVGMFSRVATRIVDNK